MEKREHTADLNKAADYFDRAMAEDPNYAAGLCWLSLIAMCFYRNGDRDRSRNTFPRPRAAANKALQIVGNDADARVSLGMVAFGEKLDLREAKREFERAIQLNPNYGLAHYCLGYSMLRALGESRSGYRGVKADLGGLVRWAPSFQRYGTPDNPSQMRLYLLVALSPCYSEAMVIAAVLRKINKKLINPLQGSLASTLHLPILDEKLA